MPVADLRKRNKPGSSILNIVDLQTAVRESSGLNGDANYIDFVTFGSGEDSNRIGLRASLVDSPGPADRQPNGQARQVCPDAA
ncbi:hypothetical protein BK146_31715 [Paenibacillus sp. FSL R7-0333]|nr:hypothetical protein BK146_31715 [Paenibacillus sp. FSL R7-0333]